MRGEKEEGRRSRRNGKRKHPSRVFRRVNSARVRGTVQSRAVGPELLNTIFCS